MMWFKWNSSELFVRSNWCCFEYALMRAFPWELLVRTSFREGSLMCFFELRDCVTCVFNKVRTH